MCPISVKIYGIVGYILFFHLFAYIIFVYKYIKIPIKNNSLNIPFMGLMLFDTLLVYIIEKKLKKPIYCDSHYFYVILENG